MTAPSLTSLAGRWRVVELLREYGAEIGHKYILKALVTHFGAVPPGLEAEVKTIRDESVLDAVMGLAVSCSSLEQFQAEMRAIPRPPELWDPADEPDPDPESEPEPGPHGTQ